MTEYYLQARYSYDDCDSKSLWVNKRWRTSKDGDVIDDCMAHSELLKELPSVKREDSNLGVVSVEYRIIKIEELSVFKAV